MANLRVYVSQVEVGEARLESSAPLSLSSDLFLVICDENHPTQGGKFLRSSDRSIEIMSAPHSNADDSEPPPTVSISPGPLGSSRSNAGSPILSKRDVSPPLSTPASPSFRLGATSQEINGTGGQ